jgi:hypothetical protein
MGSPANGVMTVAMGLLLATVSSIGHAEDTASDCRVGIYHLHDSNDVLISPSMEDAHLDWQRWDGTMGVLTRNADGTWSSTLGWTSRPDGKRVSFSECAKGDMVFDGIKGKRIALSVTNTRFHGTDASLAGRLVMPVGSAKVPIVVLVHGAEDTSALKYLNFLGLFPSQGIGTFVYDKRGTGESGGNFSADYELLAKDAVAAMREARRLAGVRAGRVGYWGGSQGGWVAPLAATQAPVDFVITSHGLAVSPVEEDRESIALDMTRRGYGPDIVAKAMKIADATEVVIASGFKDGYERVDAIRAKYGAEPWFKYVHGDISFVVLDMPHAKARELGSKFAAGIRPYYDSMPVLRELKTPQLWILGQEDLDAPIAETLRRLKALAQDGHPITTAVFPHAQHAIYEFDETPMPEAKRTNTRHPDGYFSMMHDFIIDSRLKPPYGSSVLGGVDITAK